MKQLRKWILAGCFGLITTGSFAQFTLTGELRPRAEYRNGFKSPMDSNQTNAFFIQQRTRLNVGYKVKDYDFYVSVQDIRIWGSTAQLNVSDGFLAVHEAWAKAKFGKNWGLKLGRQEILYDDHRIFGNVDWAQQARSHDAALLQFSNDKSKLDIGAAFNQANEALIGTDYTGPSSYRDMYYGWFNHKFGEKFNLSVLSMTLGRQVDKINGNGDPYKIINYISTFGTHAKFKFGKFQAALNGYYQFGSDINTFTDSEGKTASKGFAGYLIGLDLKYQATEAFSVGLGYETQSGTSQADTNEAYNRVNHSFNPWFGTNHKFNGYMDYFYVGSSHGNVGLQDAYLKFGFKKGNWELGLDAHMFMTGFGVEILDNDTYTSEYNALIDVGDPTAAADLDPFDYKYSSYLGAELDLSVTTKLNQSVSLKAGYSYLTGSPTLYHLKGVSYYNIGNDGTMSQRDLPENQWGYIMIIFKPDFLKDK